MGELMNQIREEAIRLIEEVAGNSMEKNAVKDLEYIRGVTDLLSTIEEMMVQVTVNKLQEVETCTH